MEDKLKSKMEDVHLLFARINSSFEYTKSLSQVTAREAFVIRKYDILEHSRVNFWIITILDICILLDANGHYSLLKLLNFIESNQNKLGLNGISKEIETFRNNLSETKVTQTVKQLLHLRDKHYAHLDKVRKEYKDIAPTFEDIDYLISEIDYIIVRLFSIIYKTQLQTRIFQADKTDNLLTDLVEIDKYYENLENSI